MVSILLFILLASFLTGCVDQEFNSSSEIIVVTREAGSGTRGAFVDLVGIQLEEDNKRIDRTTKEAVTQMKTNTILTTVAGNQHSIGYVSTGTLNDTVKVITIDGVEPTTENIKSNEYKISRSFIIVTQAQVKELPKDFIHFIMSKEGQEVVGKTYTSIKDNALPYEGDKPSGKMVIAGSSSVTPIIEKLSEAYSEVNKEAVIEIQQSDSSSGIKAAMDGTADIGMSSRDLNDKEKIDLVHTPIALDGIAIIVNPANPATNLSTGQVKSIFIGDVIKWNQISE